MSLVSTKYIPDGNFLNSPRVRGYCMWDSISKARDVMAGGTDSG